MRVIRAETAGFCMGVSLALRRLERALKERAESGGGRLFTLGPIIHNPQLVRSYEERGALCLHDYRETAPSDTVVIRAHGLPCDVERALAERGVRVVDATCPKVKAAQVAIHKAHEEGGRLLLFGESEHPEVKGLLSYAGSDALVFGSLDELHSLPFAPEKNYILAAQTTQDKKTFNQAVEYAKSRTDNLTVLDTICDATRERQAEVISLASRVRSMVIVGGLNSGNTTRLADIARGMGIFTLHCENGYSLPLEELRALQPIGLSAGASTPEEQIDEVEQILTKA